MCLSKPPRFTWVRTGLVGGLAGSPPSEPAEELVLQPEWPGLARKAGRGGAGAQEEAQLGACPVLPAQPHPPRALPALVRISVRAAHSTVGV